MTQVHNHSNPYFGIPLNVSHPTTNHELFKESKEVSKINDMQSIIISTI